MKLSACIVIRNEQQVLSRCLESIKDVVSEIILVHDGPCSDNSLEIAKKYTAKIFTEKYIGEAEYHRPFSYRKASGDWILQIDADEFLSNKLKNVLYTLIENPNVDAYSFAWPYFDGKNYIKKGPFAKTLKPCLFRKDKMYMIGISHEYPRTYGVLKERSDLQLGHKPTYDNYTFSAFKTKWVKWAKLQAKQIFDIEKAPTFNIAKKKENKIFRHYLFIRQHPILTGLTDSLKFLTIYLSRGILWSGLASLKIAFFELSYIWLVKKNLEYLKYGRKI